MDSSGNRFIMLLQHHSETLLVILRYYWSLDLAVKHTRKFVSGFKYVTIMPLSSSR